MLIVCHMRATSSSQPGYISHAVRVRKHPPIIENVFNLGQLGTTDTWRGTRSAIHSISQRRACHRIPSSRDRTYFSIRSRRISR
jgi:hypothetical protein